MGLGSSAEEDVEPPVKSIAKDTRNEEVITKEMRNKMEATTDNITLPPIVNVEDIINKTKQFQYQLYHNLKTRGYCPIKGTPSLVAISEKLTDVSFQFLGQELEVKKRHTDAIGNNLGFIHIPSVREYIKLRPSDPEELWPTYPPDFKDAFNAFFEAYSQIAFNSFDLLATYVDESSQDPLILPDHVVAIKQFIKEKSSISMIKYFELKETTEVCGEHTDTGILTFITRTHRPSLEIWDKQEQKYVKIEELLEEGDIIAFVGEKIPLFSRSNKITSTPHRVRMDPGGERVSIGFSTRCSKIKTLNFKYY